MDGAPLGDLEGHLRRKDFSRWITNVFGDYRLGVTVSDLEEQYRAGSEVEIAADLIREIRSRYDFVHDGLDSELITAESRRPPPVMAKRSIRQLPQVEW